MTEKKALIWIAGFALLCGALYLVQSVLLPFAAGLILAYFLDPLVDKLETWKVPRMVGTILVIGLFTLAFVSVLVLLVPVIIEQISAFAVKLPSYVQRLQSLITEENKAWLHTLAGENMPDVSKNVGEIVSKAVAWLSSFLQGLVTGGAAILSLFSLLVVTPVVAFYLLYDWDRMIKAVDSWIPERNRDDVRKIASDIDRALSGFIRGQALVCVTLGLFYGVALTLVKLPYGFAIGLITGLISFIPYVGSMTGLVLSLGVAIVSFYPNWTSIGLVAAIFAIGQFLEGNILSPKFVGESVGLHPVWLMFALLAFGSLFGFTGLLLAVPMAAIVGVLARFSLTKYLDSPLYKGEVT
jgi:predicted PurR-regulated permease PerM